MVTICFNWFALMQSAWSSLLWGDIWWILNYACWICISLFISVTFYIIYLDLNICDCIGCWYIYPYVFLYAYCCFVCKIYVFFPDEQKVGVKTMKTYTNRMKSENVFRAILVVQQNLTPFARTCIQEISAKFHLEVFQVNVFSLMIYTCKLFNCWILANQ